MFFFHPLSLAFNHLVFLASKAVRGITYDGMVDVGGNDGVCPDATGDVFPNRQTVHTSRQQTIAAIKQAEAAMRKVAMAQLRLETV